MATGFLSTRRTPVAASPLHGTTVLAVSPHADDAALSLGASLAELAARGTRVHVFTVFVGIPTGPLSARAVRSLAKSGLPPDGSAMKTRRQEDLAANEELRATAHHGDLLEAIYRRRADGSWLIAGSSDMFGETAPAEPELEQEIAARVSSLAHELAADLIVTCAGIGGHIDHRRVRAAVEQVGTELREPVALWEDLPYAIGQRAARRQGRRVAVAPGPAAWEGKLTAVSAFATQLTMLWKQGDWREGLLEHARSRGGGTPVELVWTRRQRRS
jgi:LmbE family N-acetylglucosaminyl deacetylase